MVGLLLFYFDYEAIDSKYDYASSLVILLSGTAAASQMPFPKSLNICVLLIFLYHSL
jgi:hypothetical protein